MRARCSRLVGAVLLGAWGVSCQPSSLGVGSLGAANMSLGGGQGDVCPSVRRPDEPSVVHWDATALMSLKANMSKGGVVVRYGVEGCKATLELLPYCVMKGATYQFHWLPGAEKIEVKTSREVFAELPLGAARLSGRVGGGRMVRVDAMLAGLAELPLTVNLDRGSLEGDEASCAKATHVVARFYLGGFTMVSGESSRVSAKASVFGVGGGGDGESGLTVENSVGQKAACEAAQASEGQQAGCSFPLRIGLRSLDASTRAATTPNQASPLSPPAAPLASSTPAQTAATMLPRTTIAVAPAPPSSTPSVAANSTDKGGAMVSIVGGAFDMGSNEDGSEKPVHAMTVSSFSMRRTEVTVADYRRCVAAGACSTKGLATYPGCNWGKMARDDHPINCVDLSQAEAYCRWAGQRLPSEPEWEYAARGGSEGRRFPWGNEEPSGRACFGRSTAEGTCRVGTLTVGASKQGVHDMLGNVWEWTSTPFCRYDRGGYETCGSTARVIRGGGFNTDVAYLRGSFRIGEEPSARLESLGVRCAKGA